ncbi:MAG: ABC transporter ATP-binding protein, partial [Planctomycetota bacterium]
RDLRMKLRAEGLTRQFGDLTAVDDLSFELGHGEIWGFIGPNGAGKTTTLRMLATVDQPTAGDAWLDGLSVTRDADEVRPRIGFMPDFYGAYPDMLVSEYLDFFARSYGLWGRARRRAIRRMIEFTEIGDLLSKKVADLSKGQRQRISLGRTLVHDPDLLLLDEPAAGLDPQARKDVRELLKLLATREKTIFVSSHILAELEDLVDKVLIIHEGRKVYSGSASQWEEGEERTFTLRIRLLGDRREAAEALLETPFISDVNEGGKDELKATVTGGREAVATIVERLVEEGQKPYRVMTEDRALERMFLETTAEADDE